VTREINLDDDDGDELEFDQAAADAAAREAALAHAESLQAGESEDFDAFWAGVDRKPTTLRNVFGADLTLPPSLPLKFEVEARKAQESKDEGDTKRLVGILFGGDVLDVWTDRGMDLEQFSVLLMWGTANTRSPGSMSLTEARDIYLARAASPGKAEGTAPATTSGAGSPVTGPRSKRTSAGSTGSKKKKSRG
jgi:hypothetical protein